MVIVVTEVIPKVEVKKHVLGSRDRLVLVFYDRMTTFTGNNPKGETVEVVHVEAPEG